MPLEKKTTISNRQVYIIPTHPLNKLGLSKNNQYSIRLAIISKKINNHLKLNIKYKKYSTCLHEIPNKLLLNL